MHGQSHQQANSQGTCCLPILADAVSTFEFKPDDLLLIPEKIVSDQSPVPVSISVFQNKSPPSSV